MGAPLLEAIPVKAPARKGPRRGSEIREGKDLLAQEVALEPKSISENPKGSLTQNNEPDISSYLPTDYDVS